MRVFDCFQFFNEVEALSIRLHELHEIVDYHVIVEATTTHSGRPRSVGFDVGDPRWAPFLQKVIHVVVDDMPTHAGDWDREHFQRNAILRGLDGFQPGRRGPVCDPSDLVLISDADEIPRAESVRWVADHLDRGVAVFEQELYYYYLNLLAYQPNKVGVNGEPDPVRWLWAKAARRAEFESPQGIRTKRVKSCVVVPNGGWHFSYLGGISRIQTKIDAFAHQELNLPQYVDPANIRDAIESGRDLYGRDDTYEFRVVPIDARFPRVVVENQGLFAPAIAKVDESAAQRPMDTDGAASERNAGI
jgi:beta-1,4-mannosyl-glycoprotein beta-1,4-N-acetylglucosaminyltransferase